MLTEVAGNAILIAIGQEKKKEQKLKKKMGAKQLKVTNPNTVTQVRCSKYQYKSIVVAFFMVIRSKEMSSTKWIEY